MLFKIDYWHYDKPSGEKSKHTKFVNHVADQVEAVRRFMDDFFAKNHDAKVRIEMITDVQLIGDLSNIEVIDAAIN